MRIKLESKKPIALEEYNSFDIMLTQTGSKGIINGLKEISVISLTIKGTFKF